MPLGSVEAGKSEGRKADAWAWVGVLVNSLHLKPVGVNKAEKRTAQKSQPR